MIRHWFWRRVMPVLHCKKGLFRLPVQSPGSAIPRLLPEPPADQPALFWPGLCQRIAVEIVFSLLCKRGASAPFFTLIGKVCPYCSDLFGFYWWGYWS